MHTGRLPEAERELREALELAERALASNPEDTNFRSEPAGIHSYLGDVLIQEGREADAEDHLRSSIRLHESLMKDFPETPIYRAALCGVSGTLGESLRAMGRLPEAEGCLRRAIELALKPDDRGGTGADVWGWGILFERLGLVCLESGRDHDAADAFREALARYEREDQVKPDVYWQKLRYARFLTRCPPTQFRDPGHAVALARRALQWAPQSSGGWQALGEAEYRSGHWEAAIEALVNATKFGAKDDPSVALYLAMANWRVGREAEARRMYDRARRRFNPRGPRDATLRRLVAESAALLGLPEPTAPARKEVPHRPRG
jgi:tetratricopeptide (TPR) repeat protein